LTIQGMWFTSSPLNTVNTFTKAAFHMSPAKCGDLSQVQDFTCLEQWEERRHLPSRTTFQVNLP
jgi:hypothetical protein